MEELRLPVMILAITLASYALSMVIGYLLARRGVLSRAWLMRSGRRLSDPWTTRVHAWTRKYKTACIRRCNWGGIFALIFLNNLVLAAFISGTLYGLIIFPPYLITVWRGLSHGAHWGRMGWAPRSFLAWAPMVEFLAYVCASAVGINLGLSLLSSAVRGTAGPFVDAWRVVGYAYPIIAALLVAGALFEVAFFVKMSRIPGAREKLAQVDLDQCVKEYVRRVEEEAASPSRA